jgi:anthranilate synthase/aminodeoxychorismate synthase-like glutamine amidotransferase
MWLLIDNYDSYTYILWHYLRQLNDDVVIYKNDAIDIQKIEALNPECIIISPGPKRPKDAGCIMDVISAYIGKIPLLGICLGHQAIGEYLGAKLVHAPYPMHGKIDVISFEGNNVCDNPFRLLGTTTNAMRYHSLVLEDLHNANLRPLAYSNKDNALMMFDNEALNVVGIQFHPESIGTIKGLELLKIWYQHYIIKKHTF